MNSENDHSLSPVDCQGRVSGPGLSPDRPCYEIRIEGHLDDRWAAWFHGCSLTREEDGTTTMVAPVVDMAELFGLLNKLRDLSLSLISVNRA